MRIHDDVNVFLKKIYANVRDGLSDSGVPKKAPSVHPAFITGM